MSSLYLKAWDSKTFGDFKICCDFLKNESLFQMDFSFTLQGPLKEISGIPKEDFLKSPSSNHFHETLWQHTCLEIFVGAVASPEYWEWNLSPDLNSYACFPFSHERKRATSLRATSNIAKPFDLTFQRKSQTEVTWNGKLDLSFWSYATWLKDTRPSQIKIGMNAILEKKNGEQSFWALTHENTLRPDFHLAANRNTNWEIL